MSLARVPEDLALARSCRKKEESTEAGELEEEGERGRERKSNSRRFLQRAVGNQRRGESQLELVSVIIRM